MDDELERKVKKLRKRVKVLEQSHTELRVKVDVRDKRIEALSTAMRQFANRLGKLESEDPLVEEG
jgi:chromosome segregation ATPase